MTWLEMALLAAGLALLPLLGWLVIWNAEGREREPQRTGWRIGSEDDGS